MVRRISNGNKSRKELMDELNAKKIRTVKKDDKPIGMIVWNGSHKLDFYTPNGGYKDFQVISNISDGGAKKVMNMWAKDIKNNNYKFNKI